MSQYGMQMPGGQLQRGAGMTVYTGLLALAVASLVAACLVVAFVTGPAISPGGNVFSQHPYDSVKKEYKVELPN